DAAGSGRNPHQRKPWKASSVGPLNSDIRIPHRFQWPSIVAIVGIPNAEVVEDGWTEGAHILNYDDPVVLLLIEAKAGNVRPGASDSRQGGAGGSVGEEELYR